MKYLDRKKLGIELFLALRSSAFSRRNELTPEEFVERLAAQPLHTRMRVSGDVKEALSQLKSSRYDVVDSIPEEVLSLNLNDVNAEHVTRLKPFFAWLISLWRDNDHARSQWVSQLKTVTGTFATNAGESLLAVATGNTQRVLIRRVDEKTLEMSLHERSWGRLSLRFPNCEVSADMSFPMLGFIYIMEAGSAENGRYSFEILLDTEFSSTADTARALRGENWRTLMFESDAPEASLDALDYMKNLRMRGVSMLKAIRGGSAVLCDKKAIAGEKLLTHEENAVFDIAWLINYSKRLADLKGKADGKTECSLFELFENRYKFRQIIRLFEQTGDKDAVKELEKIEAGVEAEDDAAVLKAAVGFSEALDYGASQGTNMPLLTMLCEELSTASAAVEESGENRESLALTAAQALKRVLEPELEKNGFTGAFPNYRRTRRKYGEIFTVTMPSDKETIDGGMMTFCFSACAAKLKRTREERVKNTMRGVDFAQVFATDLAEEQPHISKSGTLDCACEAGGVLVTMDMRTGECEKLDEASVTELVDAALRAMKGKSLKRAQLKRRRADKKAKVSHPFIRAFMRFLPVSTLMCVAALAAYLLLCRYSTVIAGIPLRYACIPVALAGVATALIASLIYCLARRNKLWRY